MSNIKRVATEVIDAKKKDKHPFYFSEHDECKYITVAANHADKLARALLVMEEALASNERFLDSIKSELCASVYTVIDDEFEKVYACRDFATEALAQAEEILK